MSIRVWTTGLLAGGLLLGLAAGPAGCTPAGQRSPIQLRLVNQTTFVVDPDVQINGVPLTDLGGAGSPFAVLLAGEQIAKQISCESGMRLTIVSPTFTLPNTVSGGQAQGLEATEGVNFSCGATLEVVYSRSSAGRFTVELRVVN